MITSLLVLAATTSAAGAEDDDATAGGGGAVASPADAGRPADKGSFGVGIVLGEPTGLCAKLYLDDDTAIQGALGFNFIDSGIQVNAEYVLHPWIVQERDAFVLPIYLGPGLRFIQYNGGRSDDNHYAVGLRLVGGMLFDFKEVPLDVFLEIAGVVEYDFKDGEGVELALNLGAGVRYYF
jgi:hypothetical protein